MNKRLVQAGFASGLVLGIVIASMAFGVMATAEIEGRPPNFQLRLL